MEIEARPRVKIHQSLFGYKDGHRLIESSFKFSNDAETMLLRLSDLAPGVSGLDADGYWTGAPLVSEQYYALLRTWPAPEMSRPGCVWTHALYIGSGDIARFSDLSVLRKLAVRPTLNAQNHRYSKPLLIDIDEAQDINDDDSLVKPDNLLRLIRAIYVPDEEPYLLAEGSEFDDSLFRIWSQQWPRLRRSFTFRTTGSLPDRPAMGLEFDFRLIHQSRNFNPELSRSPLPSPEHWEAEAVKDALSSQPTAFRKFLWRYGSDIPNDHESFRFLSKLYVQLCRFPEEFSNRENLLQWVNEMLPDPLDGKALKDDLLGISVNDFSLIGTIDPISSLEFLIQNPLLEGLALSENDLFVFLRQNWLVRESEILDLAEVAVKSKSNLKRPILAALVELIDEASVFATTDHRPQLRYHLIVEKPSFLNCDYLLKIGQPELSKLLVHLPDDPQLAAQVIERLVLLDDKEVAKEMVSRFPEIVMRCLMAALEGSSSNDHNPLPRAWAKIITKSTIKFLAGGHIEEARSMSALATLAEILGYRNPGVLEVGPLPWVTGLSEIQSKISSRRKDKFYAFLLMLAIEKPVQGCEPIFELTFEHIYKALESGRLSYDARSLVEVSKGEHVWWKRWDVCLDLRRAVIRAYVDANLDKDSFGRLASNKTLAESLVFLARDTVEGRKFLKRKK